MDSGWKCTVCGHVSPDGFGSCEGCMEKEIQRLTKENEKQADEIEHLCAALKKIIEMQRNYRAGRESTLPINDYTSGFFDGLSTASDAAIVALRQDHD